MRRIFTNSTPSTAWTIPYSSPWLSARPNGQPPPRPVRVAADERVQVRVERVRHVLLDARRVGQRRGLEVDHDRQPAERARQQLRACVPISRRASRYSATSVQQLLVGHELLVGELAVGRIDVRDDVQRDRARRRRAAGRPRAPRAGTPRRRGTRSPRRSPRGSACGSPSRRAARACSSGSASTPPSAGSRVGDRVDAGDRAAQHGQRAGRDVARAPAAVAVAASSAGPRPSAAPRRTASSRRPSRGSPARTRSRPSTTSSVKWRSNSVEPTKFVAQLPALPVARLGVLDLERLARPPA